jgi:DNA-3-methyladenine glycosylase
MFGPPGYAYVYFIYGMHWMLNVVTEEEGFPAAVLLRAMQPVEGLETMRTLRRAGSKPRIDRNLTNGPARLTQALAIDGRFNGIDLVDGAELWLESGDDLPEAKVERGPRIGINYAVDQDRQIPWRFWVRHNPHVSR